MTGSLFFAEDQDAYIAFCQKTAGSVSKKACGIRARGKDTLEFDLLREDILQKISQFDVNMKSE